MYFKRIVSFIQSVMYSKEVVEMHFNFEPLLEMQTKL